MVEHTTTMGQANGALDRALADAKVSPYGMGILALCFFISMTEGYDVQVMALAAPLVRAAWGLQASQIGVLLSASVIGLVVGGFLLSPIGDRIGRKPAILLGLAIAALGTFAGAYAPDVPTLLATRALAGLGLGLALPVTLALAMEMMPPRHRTLVIVVVMCGLPLGGGLGSWAAGHLVAAYDYRVVFMFGGGCAAVAALIALLGLPESPYILARKAKSRPRLERLLRRLGTSAPDGELIAPSRPTNKLSVVALFTPERRAVTTLLWVVNFFSTATVYFFFNWLPSLLVMRGLSADLAIKYVALFSLGGVGGGLLMACAMRYFGPTKVLAGGYIITALTVVVLGLTTSVGAMFTAAIAISGAAISGSQFCIAAVASQYYPSQIRVTGSGYAASAGRAGAMAAPLLGGALLMVVASSQHVFLLLTAPALAALVGVIMLGRTRALPQS